MKIIVKLLIIFFCLFLSHTTNPYIPKIHIYYDPATSAALLQMTDYIRQDKRDIKLIYWNRYHGFIKNKDSYPNTYFINRWDPFFDKLKEVVKQNPNSQIILHHNLHHEYFFKHFISVIPKNRIMESHAYEDASNYIWWSKGRNYIFYQNKDMTHKLHIWGDIDKFCTGENPLGHCPEIKKLKEYTEIIPVDFYKIRKKLSNSDKEKLSNLAGIDLKKYQKLLQNKQTGVHLLGFVAGTNLESFQLVSLKSSCSAHPDVNWFYKPHPSKHKTPSEKVLNHFCPNIKRLDPHLPFEFLILTDLNPKYVSGMGSSTFFNLKQENILSYTARGKKDFYVPTLKKADILPKKGKLITYEMAIQKLNKLNIIWADKNGWLVKVNDEYCQMNGRECYQIVSDTSDKKVLKNKKGALFQTTYVNSTNWTLLEPITE